MVSDVGFETLSIGSFLEELQFVAFSAPEVATMAIFYIQSITVTDFLSPCRPFAPRPSLSGQTATSGAPTHSAFVPPPERFSLPDS